MKKLIIVAVTFTAIVFGATGCSDMKHDNSAQPMRSAKAGSPGLKPKAEETSHMAR